MKRYFVTGTDTDCGKTYVTRKLTDYYANSIAIKPVASGCSLNDGELVSSDAQQLKLNSPLSLHQINPWRFQLPVSPHIAAQYDGVSLNINELADYCVNFNVLEQELLFIEGAGGIMVPLNEKETWIDFLNITEIPVILVVGMKLGCINHALLSAVALRTHKINCIGWIANCIDAEMLALDENIQTLKTKLNIPLLAILPFGGELIDINLQRVHP